MIIKVIPNMIGSSVEERVTGLSDYIHHPKQTRAHHLSEYIHQLHPGFDENLLSEKCVYSNSRNFLDDDPHYQKIEMSQTASLNSRVIDPIVHMVGSFKKFEVPTTEQLEEQIDILVKHLGAEELQMQYAVHMDTDNVHFHLIINKVHPFKKNKHGENKVIDLGDGWIIYASHQAIAEIEAKQGWLSEPNPLFIFNHQTQKCEKNPHYSAHNSLEQLTSKIKDQEHRHQQNSNLRTEIWMEESPPARLERIISKALSKVKNWEEWHNELAKFKLSYELKRNGAIFNFHVLPKPVSFKSSDFCQKSVTLRALEKKWGAFQPASKDIVASLTQNKQINPYHLFKKEDYLLKELHTAYLKYKNEKDQITAQNRNESDEINFLHLYFRDHKQKLLSDLQRKFPEVNPQTIKTLLHYKHKSDQTKYKKERRAEYAKKHQRLSQKVSERLKQRFDFSPSIQSEKITSYDDFLKLFDRENTYLIQQKFLFDQRQSANFIWHETPECNEAKLIFDQHLKHEPIGIQNKFGIQVFSNYSLSRIHQCLKWLNNDKPITFTGDSDFRLFTQSALDNRDGKIHDSNVKRKIPRLSSISQSDLDLYFEDIFSKFADKSLPSTALLKTSLLLSCCGVSTGQLNQSLKHLSQKNELVITDKKDQEILMLRLKSLTQTQSRRLNIQYFNSEEIDWVWKIYLELDARILQRDDKDPSPSVLRSELELVPIVPKGLTYAHIDKDYVPHVLDEHEQHHLIQRFLNLQKVKRSQNKLQAASPVPNAANDSSLRFPKDKYTIEYRFGHTFYLDQHETAFIEAKDASCITVVSETNHHILDALLLAQQKYGTVQVYGSDTFKDQVKGLATQYNIPILLEEELEQVFIQPTSFPSSLELSLEERDLSIPVAEERAQNFYENQKIDFRAKDKEQNHSKDNDLKYGL
ncbi:relaxase/mobilization nuclease domain-containing protein [Acinetobacter towneri]|uniref:relaxase/mobilization nuclease domain-containing protein n=1 Tax=Acinetobacter towneri TaxID=202956 RepID=UPI001F390E52|nr:relaxase/mobilization nuclease domain-containing protein [Acinetobacter towneri]UIP26555.1 relaxase/mobilization nuclease domain-containing protein [Acinetobacter towneri]